MGVRRTVSEHYNHVTRAWLDLMGNHFHVGYFDGGTTSLDDATGRLVEELADWGGVEKGMEVLDVGCGSGAAALELHRKYAARVTGVSLSEDEVEVASSTARELGLDGSLRFLQCDLLENTFPDGGFDLLWLMESSHLFREKGALFSEAYRLLRKQGKLLLCDFYFRRPLEVRDLFQFSDALEGLERAFGRVRSETLAEYEGHIAASGFCAFEARDVTEQVRATPSIWLERMEEKKERISEFFTAEDIEAFGTGCRTIRRFFEEGILGYAFMRADKKRAS